MTTCNDGLASHRPPEPKRQPRKPLVFKNDEGASVRGTNYRPNRLALVLRSYPGRGAARSDALHRVRKKRRGQPATASSPTATLLRCLRARRALLACPRAELRDPAGDDVEDRGEDQPEGGDADHAEEHRGAKRLAQLGAGADRPDQRTDTENEGERGHQDRPQAQPRGFDRRIPAAAPLILELARELDDQDRILGGGTDQAHKADMGED